MEGIKLFALMGEIGIKGLEKVVSGLDTVIGKAKKTGDSNKKLGNSFKALQDKVKSNENRLKSLKDKYSNIVMQEGKNSSSAKALKKEMVLLNSELKKDKEQLDKVSKSSDIFTSSLEKVENKSDSVRDKLGNFANGVTGVGKAMTGFITTGVGAIAGMGLAHNVEMEKMEANLTVLLGSSEKAEKKLEELRTMGAKTPFETKDLLNATQKMLAFGLQSDKTGKYLQTLGDISMGDAQKLDSLTLAFSQMGANSKASMEDINQMIDAGFNPLNFIASQTGESMVDLRDRVSEGKVSFEEIAGAMQYATSTGQPFHNSMQTASETTSGKISTLKDNFSTMVGELTESLLPIFQKVVDKTSEIIEKFSNLSTEQKENILKAGLLVGAIGPLLMVIGGLINLVKNTIAVFKTVKTVIDMVKLSTINLNLAFLANPMTWVIAGIVALVAAFVVLWNKSEAFRNFWINLWDNIKKAVSNVGQFMQDFLSKTFDRVKNLASNLWAGIRNVFSSVGSFFGGVFSDAYHRVTSIFNSIGGFFSGVWNRIRYTFSSLGTSIGNSISGAVRGALNGVINAIERTINRGIGLINGAIGLINKLPGVSVGRLGLLRLPRLFRGGVLEKGQVGILEGNGAEAVVPLENNKKWLRALGEDMQNTPGLTGGNNEQLEELVYLFKKFINTFSRQRLVLDTGVLVGELAPGVNKALAKESDKNKRGR